MENNRIWEIDFFKVTAIILMVIYHFVYDLSDFTKFDINIDAIQWVTIQKLSGFLFIFLAGLNSGFSKKPVKRGIKVFGYGMLITLATYFALKGEYIRFGVLHLIGVSMILSILLQRLDKWILLSTAIASYIIGIVASRMVVNTFLLLPFGFMYPGFVSVDYYPILPYISYFILGLLVYKMYYFKRKSAFKFSLDSHIVRKISQNSLLIYLIHQPVFLAVINVLKFFQKL